MFTARHTCIKIFDLTCTVILVILYKYKKYFRITFLFEFLFKLNTINLNIKPK